MFFPHKKKNERIGFYLYSWPTVSISFLKNDHQDKVQKTNIDGDKMIYVLFSGWVEKLSILRLPVKYC